MKQDKPSVVALFRPGGKGEGMEPLSIAEALTGVGFKGDRKAKPGSKRQVLLLDSETVEEFGFRPGELDENVTTRGLAVGELQRGQQVRIGDVLLEVTIECPACYKLENLRPGLEAAMRHRRGMMTIVLQGGQIHVGDSIEVLDARPEAVPGAAAVEGNDA
jgi:MOSC domain-containing protein YiiM